MTAYFVASMIASGSVVAAFAVMFRLQTAAMLIPMLLMPFVMANGLTAVLLRMHDDSYGAGIVALCALHGLGLLLALAGVVGFLRQRSFRLFD